MVSRAETRRCYVYIYISSLCWCVVGGKKQRKISSESECERLKNLRFVSNATCTTKNETEFEEKDSREMSESFAFVCGST